MLIFNLLVKSKTLFYPLISDGPPNKYSQLSSRNSCRFLATNSDSTDLMYFAIQATKASKDLLFAEIEDIADRCLKIKL